jgi:uracil-DNA glycosylase family 4
MAPTKPRLIKSWTQLNQAITECEQCPRLRSHCLEIARVKRKSYMQDTYWGRPITGFGDPLARLVIVGLAPAAHGANRTGRIFTGDRSGDWLYRALHKAGFASQPTSVHKDDGLTLEDCFITATVKCAPPDNKPDPDEIQRCLSYLRWELDELKTARVYLALGKIGFDQTWNILKQTGQVSAKTPRPAFAHGAAVELESGRRLLASYHPSQQNTFTGKLTEPMFDWVFQKARKYLD